MWEAKATYVQVHSYLGNLKPCSEIAHLCTEITHFENNL